MPFSCAFDAGFSNAFEICPPTDEAQPDTRYLRGVPSAIPRIRKRPDVADIRGEGWIGVIGVGKLAGEACLEAELLQEVECTAVLTRDTFRVLVGEIPSGAEAVLAGEKALEATAVVAVNGYGRVVGEVEASGAGIQRVEAWAKMTGDGMIRGRLSIRVGAEGSLTQEQNNQQVVLALLGLPSDFVL